MTTDDYLNWGLVLLIALVSYKWISVIVAARNAEDKKVRMK